MTVVVDTYEEGGKEMNRRPILLEDIMSEADYLDKRGHRFLLADGSQVFVELGFDLNSATVASRIHHMHVIDLGEM